MKKRKRTNKKYSGEFKVHVIMDMRANGLSYKETVRKYNLGNTQTGGARLMVQRWERIYLEEGAVGLMRERRGRTTKAENPKVGRPKKKPLDQEVERDLIAENQRLKERNEYLEMELEYLKKLDALIRAEEEKNGKKPQ